MLQTAKYEQLTAWCAPSNATLSLAAGGGVPEACIRANAARAEKPHQGGSGINRGLYQGYTACKSTIALGFRASWVENCSGAYGCARYYDPTIGRFISEDSTGFSGGINFYVYAGNSASQYIDPFGLRACCKLPADGDASFLARVVFAEATIPNKRNNLMAENSHKEMLAISFSLINRAAFLKTHPKQQYMFRHNDDTIQGVFVKEEYATAKKDNWRFNASDDPDKLSDENCDMLSKAIAAANEALKNPAADPFNEQGGTFGLRPSYSLNQRMGQLFRLPTISGATNVFFGFKE